MEESIKQIISTIILKEENKGSIFSNNQEFMSLQKQLTNSGINKDLLNKYTNCIIESMLNLKEEDCVKVFKYCLALGFEIKKDTLKD